jgi:transglutaminase-like putative cysteine protease
LRITPLPATQSERTDYFGNRVTLFTIQEPHELLEIEARSVVEIDVDAVPWTTHSPAWDEVAARLPEDPEVCQFVYESPRVQTGPEFGEYAKPSFPRGRPLAEAVLDLTARIHGDFRFDRKATGVRTKPAEVLALRRGVCQDFAQLQIACLRSLNLAARYVSGYLRTTPPPGRPRLKGADASHAWVSVYCPGAGWLDVDPTNNLVPSDSHVTLAWGRDYGDVSPVRGVIVGGLDHTLEVAVDMEPLAQ